MIMVGLGKGRGRMGTGRKCDGEVSWEGGGGDGCDGDDEVVMRLFVTFVED